jgi:perosamine synthetase
MIKLSQALFSKYYFGFIQGHSYLTVRQWKDIKNLLSINDEKINKKFEIRWSELVGDGQSVSFASARMAFYALLTALDIGEDDEVILNAGTCSVMVNAVLRVKAKPLFSDVDPSTLGSSLEGILKCVTPNTKLIVAQHSFGIPCQIDLISAYCLKNNLFLVEDSALSFGSMLNNKPVGSFGDAALFSTDHTKPINTFTGGLLYSKNNDVFNRVSRIQKTSYNLSLEKKTKMLDRIILESKYTAPNKNGLLQLIDIAKSIKNKFYEEESPYLDKDNNIEIDHDSYPYPAKLPTFLAFLGIIELSRWSETETVRKKNLERYISFADNHNLSKIIPESYYDSYRKIVPLRVAWYQSDGDVIRNKMRNFLQVSWIWFKHPIVSTTTPLEEFGYVAGSCQASELIGKGIVNLPTSMPTNDFDSLLKNIEEIL